VADTVTARITHQSPREVRVHLTNLSDGTGETNVVKVDKSTLTASTSGAEAAKLALEYAGWNIQGFAYVKLSWDLASDETIAVLTGSGSEDFADRVFPPRGYAGGDGDQSSVGGSPGDVLLTAPAGAASGSYDIRLHFRKLP
jgi:hypothetical protein